MGSIISAIADDEDDYDRLCRKYGEKPELMYNHNLRDYITNPYGKHAAELKERERKEHETK